MRSRLDPAAGNAEHALDAAFGEGFGDGVRKRFCHGRA